MMNAATSNSEKRNFASPNVMEIYFLGTGTAVPVENHSPAGLFVVTPQLRLLMDIGPGSLSRLNHIGFSVDQIDYLFLSHLHPDHTLDLITLLQVFNSAPETVRQKKFTIIGCRGCNEFLLHIYDLYPDVFPSGYSLEIREVYRDEFLLGDLRVQSGPTAHTESSVAFRMEEGGRSLVYSGDASRQGELTQLACGVDLLISECSFPAGWQTEDHLNADEIGLIAQKSNAKSLVVTHLYPPALRVDLLSQIHQHYQGKAQIAVDGLRLSLE